MLGRVLRAAVVAALLVVFWPADAARTSDDERVLVLVTLRGQPASRFAASDGAAASAILRGGVGRDATPGARDEARSRRAARLLRQVAPAAERAQEGLRRHVDALGGEVVYAGRAFNAVAASVPRSALAELGARPDVASVEIDEPRAALLGHVAPATLATAFWAQGVTGGAVDVAVLDTGLYVDHEAFAARRTSVRDRVFHRAAGTYPEYYDIATDPDDYAGHGTLVSGLVFSQGAALSSARKGLAHGLDTLYNLKAGFATRSGGGASLLSDLMEAVDWALSQDDTPEVFNYSFGAPAATDDDLYARYWDGVVDAWGTVATISAGNGGPSGSTLNSPGIAYNVLSVANLDSRGTVSRADDVVASSSSRGPTVAGRRKPDIAAPGTAIVLPSNYGRATWVAATGTSFSAPAIAGAAALLIDAGVTDPRAVKAVLINSADDLGAPGWDADYGWGSFNGARAWDERAAWRLDAYGAPGTPGAVRFFERAAASPTTATLVWHRHVAYAASAGALAPAGVLNDLDLRLYSAATGALRAVSASRLDNVERVTSPASEAAVLLVETVAPFSAFEGATTETAALAHGGGFVERLGPAIELTVNAPGTVAPGASFHVTALVANPGDLRGHAYEATLALPAGYTLQSPGVTQAVSSLAPGQQALVTWTVRAPGIPIPPAAMVVSGRTASYGVSWTTSGAAAVTVGAGCSYDVAPPGPLASAGGTASVIVAAPDGCAWSAASGSQWLSVQSGTPGSGAGQVTLAASPNSATSERSGTVVVAGVSVAVTQAGAAPPQPRAYHLAEGATGGFFDLDIAIANPNDVAVPVDVTFLRPGGSAPPIALSFDLAAYAQRVIRVDAIDGLEDTAVSTIVTSRGGAPLVVERTMFWGDAKYGGHGGTAVDGPRHAWYFAEGAQGFFDTFVLLANATKQPATVKVTFLREGGEPPLVATVGVDAHSRETVWARALPDLADRAFSIVVESDVPIVAERAMYFPGIEAAVPDARLWEGGHESAGVAAPATTWFHAEGATGDLFDEYVLVGNPGPAAGTLTFTFLLSTGQVVVAERQIAAMSRFTLDVENLAALVAAGEVTLVSGDAAWLRAAEVSTTVSSTVPVVSERAMYWAGGFGQWHEAHNSFGVTQASPRWGLAEGRAGGAEGFDTYILLANPNPTEVDVRVTLLRQDGRPPIARTFRLGRTSRFNVHVALDAAGDDPGWGTLGLQPGEGFGAIVESLDASKPIVVERAVYWSGADRLFWTGGTNATGAALQ